MKIQIVALKMKISGRPIGVSWYYSYVRVGSGYGIGKLFLELQK